LSDYHCDFVRLRTPALWNREAGDGSEQEKSLG